MKNKINRILSLVMALVMLCAVLSMTAAAAETGTLIIPNGTTSINDYAFKGRTNLTSVVIPNGVTSIGRNAFQGCINLTSVVIPNSVTSIGEGAFYGCTGLTSVVISDNVTSISDLTFAYCSKLTSVVIPNGVTSIGEYAFSGCTRLTNVVIPNSVTSISENAFNCCPNLNTSAPAAETQTLVPGQKFSDVSPNAWYAEAINAMAETGLLQGDGNGHFNPNSPITYGEFATLLCRIYGLPIDKHEYHYNKMVGMDCDGSYSWASAAIQTTGNLHRTLDGGWGYLTFWECTDANELMNRGETVRHLMDMYFRMHPELADGYNYNKFIADREANGETAYRIEEFKYETQFTFEGRLYTITETGKRIAGVADENLNDMPVGSTFSKHGWSVNAIAAAYALDLVHGDGNGYFNPRNTLTRAELCQLLYNAGITAPGCVPCFDV